jgi:hypothetical protein
LASAGGRAAFTSLRDVSLRRSAGALSGQLCRSRQDQA